MPLSEGHLHLWTVPDLFDDHGAVGLLVVLVNILLVALAFVGQLLGIHTALHEEVVDVLGPVVGDTAVAGGGARLLVGMAYDGVNAVLRAVLDDVGHQLETGLVLARELRHAVVVEDDRIGAQRVGVPGCGCGIGGSLGSGGVRSGLGGGSGSLGILKLLRERMADAAERLDFERAALIRDQIAAIEKVSRGQKVVRSEVDEQDVVAFAGTASAVCAAILRFREGRLVDKREFLFHDTQDIPALREEFLPRYYLEDNEFIPKSIAVDELPAGSGELARLLGETRGSKVRLYVPQRGDTARLVEMARTNAVERLARESGRYAREQKHLDELAALLGLKEPPKIIESYDISNWGDGTSVAGMVVFEDGKPKKAGYRRFKMNTVAGTDDYASMAETLARRAAEYEKGAKGQFGIKPDLLLIDGGRGQVSAVQAALAGTQLADVPMFGMVKDDKHRTRGLVSAAGGEIMLAMHRGVFTFVTSIQDETHRWANDYRRRMQKSRAYSSTLQSVPGVGPATSRALMAHFKTVSAVKEASEEQLAGAKGVSRAAARAVYAHFHPQPEQPSAET